MGNESTLATLKALAESRRSAPVDRLAQIQGNLGRVVGEGPHPDPRGFTTEPATRPASLGDCPKCGHPYPATRRHCYKCSIQTTRDRYSKIPGGRPTSVTDRPPTPKPAPLKEGLDPQPFKQPAVIPPFLAAGTLDQVVANLGKMTAILGDIAALPVTHQRFLANQLLHSLLIDPD